MKSSAIAVKDLPKFDWRLYLLNSLLNLAKPIEKMTWREIRHESVKPIPSVIQTVMAGQKVSLEKIVQQDIPGRHGDIPIRLYYPSTDSLLPLILFFHGGGWIYGNFQTYDRMCRRIAKTTGAVVLAVAYRLAPCYKYPIALEDCYDSLLWTIANAASIGANPQRLSIMGDGAGGNLATAVCLMNRDRTKESIASQILLYPITSGRLDQPSIDRNANAPILTRERLQCFVDHYARSNADILQPYFSPLLAQDLSKLPPTLIVTGEYDPLRDQAKMYARRLRDAKVSAKLLDYPKTVHNFMSFPPFCREALPAFDYLAGFLKSIETTV